MTTDQGVSGRMWFMNCQNNSNRGYWFHVDNIQQLIDQHRNSSFRAELHLQPKTVYIVVIGNKLLAAST